MSAFFSPSVETCAVGVWVRVKHVATILPFMHAIDKVNAFF